MSHTRCVNSLSIYFFINIFIYILPALLFRRGTALFYTTDLHFLHHLLQITAVPPRSAGSPFRSLSGGQKHLTTDI